MSYSLLAGIAGGCLAGFVMGWGWRDRAGALGSIRLLDVLTAIGTVGATITAVWLAYRSGRHSRKTRLIKQYTGALKFAAILDYGLEIMASSRYKLDGEEFDFHLDSLQSLSDEAEDPVRLWWFTETRTALNKLRRLANMSNTNLGEAVPMCRAPMVRFRSDVQKWAAELSQELSEKHAFRYPFNS